jgi:DNA-binding HxlR family transcriptional regulator
VTDTLYIPKGKYARTGYISPIDAALEVIGGKYKVAILYHMRESVSSLRLRRRSRLGSSSWAFFQSLQTND